MIRSCRIPSVLRRICDDNADGSGAIQTALLVTTDGELLGSTATTFVGPDGKTKESIESLGTLIADIAVDYSRLGEEYAQLDPYGSPQYQMQQQQQQQAQQSPSKGSGSNKASGTTTVISPSSSLSSSKGSSHPPPHTTQRPSSSSSHLQCLLLELELGLVAVAACAGVDCLVVALCRPDAPLGTVRARLHAMAAHVQEAFGPLERGLVEDTAAGGQHHPRGPGGVGTAYR